MRAAAVSHTGRPRDWHPLAGTDPVPGDPEAIHDEVAHLKRVAATLRGEARDLKPIGQGEGLKGRYADALRDGARELEVHLRETAERYERVHGHLTGWAHELEGLQAEADGILRRARADAEAVSGSGGGSVSGGVSGSGGGPGPGSASGAGGPSGAPDHGDAADADPVAKHRRALAAVEAHRDQRAAHYASRIRHEIDDKIKDSWWERFKNGLDDVQGVVSVVLDVMSWVASGIAIAAIILTPAGWVTTLALWLTVGVFGGHLLLAAAGLASWADVAMDVFGLLTMSLGSVALRGLRSVRDATKLAAELAAEERALADATRAAQPLRDRTSAVINRRGSTRAARARARHDRNIARAAARRAGHEAAAGEAATPMAQATRWERARMGGDPEMANMHKDVLRLRADYPENAAVQKASEGADEYRLMFRVAWGASTAVDGVDKGLGGSDFMPFLPEYGPYGRAKGRYVKEVGTAW